MGGDKAVEPEKVPATRVPDHAADELVVDNDRVANWDKLHADIKTDAQVPKVDPAKPVLIPFNETSGKYSLRDKNIVKIEKPDDKAGSDHKSKVPTKDDLLASANKGVEKAAAGKYFSDAAKAESIDKAQKAADSIKSLTPEDLKAIGGFIDKMSSVQNGDYDEAGKVAAEIGQAIRDKYGNDPSKQEAIANGLKFALNDSKSGWTAGSAYTYGNGEKPPLHMNFNFRGIGFHERLSSDDGMSTSKYMADYGQKLNPVFEKIKELYDQTTFIGPNRSFPEMEPHFEAAMQSILPVLEEAHQKFLKDDGHDRNFQDNFMQQFNKKLEEFAKKSGRSGEIPRVSFSPGIKASEGSKGYSSSLALDIGASRHIVLKGKMPSDR